MIGPGPGRAICIVARPDRLFTAIIFYGPTVPKPDNHILTHAPTAEKCNNLV